MILGGTPGNDTLVAAADGDMLFGGEGDDLLISRFNRTLLDGGAGGDRLDLDLRLAETGPITAEGRAEGGPGDDVIQVGTTVGATLNARAMIVCDGGAGDDRIALWATARSFPDESLNRWTLASLTAKVAAGDGDDVVFVSLDSSAPLAETILDLGLGGGDDRATIVIRASGWNYHTDTLVDCGIGNDHVTIDIRSVGSTRLFGGDGDDAITATVTDEYVAWAETLISGDGGNDVIALTVTRSDGAHRATGGAGDDVMTLHGMASAEGGDGNDLIVSRIRDGDPRQVSLSGGAGDDRLAFDAWIATADGGPGFDIADLQALNSQLSVDLGANAVRGGGPLQEPQSIASWSGFEGVIAGWHGDRLKGSADDNRLYGKGGNDVLSGGGGDDGLDGGVGRDTADFSEAVRAVAVDLAAGWAEGEGLDRLTGIEDAIGSAFDDRLIGDAEGNRLSGGAGDDALIGADGDDALDGGAGNDRLTGGAGDDRLSGGAGEDDLSGGPGDDTLDGGLGDDALSGDEGDDVLSGGAGNDHMIGGPGDDDLDGGAGDDRLSGGAGNDLFVFAPGCGNDDIADFGRGVDRIDLRAFGFGGFDEVADRLHQTDDAMSLLLSDHDRVSLLGVDPGRLGPGDILLA